MRLSWNCWPIGEREYQLNRSRLCLRCPKVFNTAGFDATHSKPNTDSVGKMFHLIDRRFKKFRKSSSAVRRALTTHGLVLEAFYRAQASDVGRDAIRHYLETGRSSGLWPHPLFDPTWYLEHYADVREAGIDPFVHFLQDGGKEGRWPNAFFDPRWYVECASGAQLSAEILRHYLEVGAPGKVKMRTFRGVLSALKSI